MRLKARQGTFRTLLKSLLTQGASPRKVAITIVIGIAVGTLPIVWGSTLLCALLASLFRLNQAGIQVVNYCAYPLQLALFVPFYRMGAKIFPWGHSVSMEVILRQLKTDWTGGIPLILIATLKALVVWLLIAPPAAILLYFVLLQIFPRFTRSNMNDSEEADLLQGELR
jgi:uncharacterized protein (DUF2062 family)